MTYIQNCKTPSLIFVGQSDPLLRQSWEFYNGIKMLGGQVEMVMYPHEGHGLFNEPAHDLDFINRVLSWYDSYLTGLDLLK